MELNTIEKANEFIKNSGVLEFVFITDNIVTYKTPIPEMLDGVLTDFEFLFFVEECDTFYRMDSFDNFLQRLRLFEIQKVVVEMEYMEVLFHRKYDSNIIESKNIDISDVDDLPRSYVVDIMEANLLKANQILEFLVGNDEFEGAIKMREKIKDIEIELERARKELDINTK